MAIHPTAIVGPKARIASDAQIGAFSIIHDNVEIGENVIVGTHCELGIPTPLGDGRPLVISADSLIRSHSVFYESSHFGKGLKTGHRVTVREMTVAGDGFQIGSLGDIQGHCSIGQHVRFQSSVFVAQRTKIGSFVWVFPNVVFTNDPRPPSNTTQGANIEDFAVISTNSTILPGVTIGQGSLVGAGSVVAKDLGKQRICFGNPARDRGDVSQITLKDGSNRSAYPWRRHFVRGYPEEIVQEWNRLFETNPEG